MKKISVKTMKVLGLLTATGVLIVSFGQGCGQFKSVEGIVNSSSMGSGSETGSGDIEDFPIDPSKPTVSLVYGKQVLDHYVSCLGTGSPSETTLAMWDSKKGAMSETGSVKTVTAPMLMAAASIAGEVCRDLINREKATPRIFVDVDLNATRLPSDAILANSLRRLTRSCWDRDELIEERNIILDAILASYSGADAANKSSDAMLFMCTTVLASLDALVL